MFKKFKFRYGIALLLLLCVFVATLSWGYSQNTKFPLVDRVLAFVMSISLDHAQNHTGQYVELTQDQLAESQATAEMNEALMMQPTVQRVLQLSTETLDESFRKLATYDDNQYGNPG